MWKLINVKKEHLEHYVVVDNEVVVGRKDASLLITNDPSVSRKHAVLWVNHPEENLGNPSKSSSLFMRDEGSKYGTFKNGVRVSSEVELFDCDIVKFGQFESEYRVSKVTLVVTTSCLDVSGKRALKKTIHSLGGHLVSEWQPVCSHLVMSEVKVTIKALCCLCSAKPIVTPKYFLELNKSLKDDSKFVCPKDFIPPTGEALIDKDVVSFDINNQRKSLFKNKNFFFFDEKQFKKLHLGIVLGGGNASILSSEKVTPELLVHDGCCVIEPIKESSQAFRVILSDVQSILQANKLRLIPESDVGLAVAYCSTEKFCNPKFCMGDAVLHGPNVQSQTLSEREVYVPDTQERINTKIQNVGPDVCNSLNFSSFHGDAHEEMEISEIPLSAQVKRELDDIFDEPMEDNVQSSPKKDTVPTILNLLDKTRKLKAEASAILSGELSLTNQNRKNSSSFSQITKKSSDNEDNKFLNKENISEKRMKSEAYAFNGEMEEKINGESQMTSHNGDMNGEQTILSRKFPLKSEKPEINGFIEPELPCNLMKIEMVSLICRKTNNVPEVQKYKNSAVKNFKKFKKVQPKKSQALPKIIGAHELVPYDKVAADICNEVWDDPADEAPQPIKGAFDWDTPTV